MLWNSRLWSGCIGITTPARIRTVKTLLQCSSRITTILKSVGQRWLAYRQELSTELGAIQWIIACIFAAGAHGLIVTLIQYRQRSSGSEASGVQLGVPE